MQYLKQISPLKGGIIIWCYRLSKVWPLWLDNQDRTFHILKAHFQGPQASGVAFLHSMVTSAELRWPFSLHIFALTGLLSTPLRSYAAVGRFKGVAVIGTWWQLAQKMRDRPAEDWMSEKQNRVFFYLTSVNLKLSRSGGDCWVSPAECFKDSSQGQCLLKRLGICFNQVSWSKDQ